MPSPGRDPASLTVSENPQRRSLFFELRGLLGIIVLAILVSHHAVVSPKLWLLGIGFLISDLLVRFLPLSWFRHPAAGYVAFFVDLVVLTVILRLLGDKESESLDRK